MPSFVKPVNQTDFHMEIKWKIRWRLRYVFLREDAIGAFVCLLYLRLAKDSKIVKREYIYKFNI